MMVLKNAQVMKDAQPGTGDTWFVLNRTKKIKIAAAARTGVRKTRNRKVIGISDHDLKRNTGKGRSTPLFTNNQLVTSQLINHGIQGRTGPHDL